MDPVTTETAVPSSLVPCPNELSLLPLARSTPDVRPVTFCQSVVPNAVGLVMRLPSPAANVLGLNGPTRGGRAVRCEVAAAGVVRVAHGRDGQRDGDATGGSGDDPGSSCPAQKCGAHGSSPRATAPGRARRRAAAHPPSR